MKASDLGDPKLSTIISVNVFIRHVTTVAPEVRVGFAEDSYTVHVAENSPTNTLIKTFTIVNNRMLVNRGIPLKCTIVSGNSESEYLPPLLRCVCDNDNVATFGILSVIRASPFSRYFLRECNGGKELRTTR